MRDLRCFVLLHFWAACGYAQSSSYLFVWAGDDAKTSSDFLAVLDADSKSPHYGHAVASAAVPGPTGTPHHTELEMPPGGFLLANAFESGRTMLFDLRQPQHPSLVTSFGDLGGYMHPHTYVRLPNGHVLATFQYHGGHEPKSDGGGLVEFDERGHLIRSSSDVCAPSQRLDSVGFWHLAKDMSNNSTPNYVYISPNTKHDAHNGTLAQADAWL